eukprot:TRINITY_DN13407_c0_g1::TRINITY_DN13407_c0_g1_i1::g.9549::m.9549 TRINITY_DN13407_c0_g1::TRINITY_DN13407_c0_g1_i1::g.9549  ORF type:complete len:161 (+),score=10.94,sp/Q5CPU3/SSAT_CRYPI/39.61/3e-28,Acetyltransf_1/PF00583.19/2.6e-15,Acetyltransf_7/PF13508.1/2.6e-08,Acetyltransf_10/PF13673.1/3.8e-05,Acetyltransf_8/PF13523.1/0.00044,Acetyltransf_CG/PF14542.1/0.00086,Acetyltransf_4/PF13420.1/0.00079,Acetyltransf_3/PF13302.1/0.0017,FR47/PF08445.5/0.0063,Acetyltransf_9/PF13527.1/0.011 TRINITY_DN13407_c0
MENQPEIMDQPSYFIRPMTMDDYYVVRKLYCLVSGGKLELTLEMLEEFLRLPSYKPVCLVYTGEGEDKDAVVAFAELHLMPHLTRGWDARIERVVVSEKHRGKGYATALCNHLITLARHFNCDRVQLTVEAADAKHIYQDKLGFKPVHTETLKLDLTSQS